MYSSLICVLVLAVYLQGTLEASVVLDDDTLDYNTANAEYRLNSDAISRQIAVFDQSLQAIRDAMAEEQLMSQKKFSQLTLELDAVKSAILQLQQQFNQQLNGGSSVTDTIATKGCPADFTFVPSVNGCYKILTRNLVWSSAGRQCRALHGNAHLLVINNATEQEAIEDLLERNTNALGLCGTSGWGLQIWTAGQRVNPAEETPFVWKIASPDGLEFQNLDMTYTNWYDEEPNYYYSSESCQTIAPVREYLWNDVPCWLEYCSVCEIDVTD